MEAPALNASSEGVDPPDTLFAFVAGLYVALVAGLYVALLVSPALLVAAALWVTASEAVVYVGLLLTIPAVVAAGSVGVRTRPGLPERLGGTGLTWGLSVLGAAVAVGYFVVALSDATPSAASGVGMAGFFCGLGAGVLGYFLLLMSRTRHAKALVDETTVEQAWDARWSRRCRRASERGTRTRSDATECERSCPEARKPGVMEPIPTGCTAVDELLGGGFERGLVTQLYGPPAAGKTNLALSAAVEVAARGDIALFIDTEGLSIDRLEQLASGRTDHVDELASNIIISEVLDFDEQGEAVQDAAEFAEDVELIVLDSATGFYRIRRSEDEEAGDALRTVARQVTHLLSLARKHDLAVVITNQVFTDPDSDRARPLGGHTLTHWSGAVVRIERFRGGNRRATLEKHQAKPAGDSARFKIVGDGLESVEDSP